MKYLALDAHSTHCVLSVRNARGEPIDQQSIRTDASRLIQAVRAIRGKKILAVEEGQIAGWLMHTFETYVDDFIICDPAKNAWIAKDETKTDPIDASKL